MEENNYNFKELFDQLNQLDEHNTIEAKEGSAIGRSVLETVSAFSNEPGLNGGFILLGVKRTENPLPDKYKIIGVNDPDKIQSDFATQCKTVFNHPICPYLWTENLGGKHVVGAKISEVEPSLKEIYIKNVGMYDGAFRRIGSIDQKFTDEDRRHIQELKMAQKFEETPIVQANITDMDPNAIAEYRKLRQTISRDSPELTYSDEELLKSLHCIIEKQGEYHPTIAGLILFGSETIQKTLRPSIKIDYIRVDGTEWVSDLESPFMYSSEFRGPLLLLIPKIIRTVVSDLPKGFSIPSGEIQRQEDSVIPFRVIRESIVNAVTHRNYNTSMPIQIIRYSNRIEIKNPGHSLIEIKNLGESGSKTRNEHISFVLHETGFAESKGSGIKVIQGEMKKANLTEPVFESSREKDEFLAIFSLHHLITAEDIQWLSKFQQYHFSDDDVKAIVFIRKNGFISNSEYREITGADIIKASTGLIKLTELGLFSMHKRGNQTYYTPNEILLEKEIDYEKLSFEELFITLRKSISDLKPLLNTIDEVEPLQKDLTSAMYKEILDLIKKIETMDLTQISTNKKDFAREVKFIADSVKNLNSGNSQFDSDFEIPIPDTLELQIQSLGSRKNPEQVERCIIKLCSLRPFTAAQLSKKFNVKPSYLKSKFITKLLSEGKLKRTIQDKPKHPNQAYVTTVSDK
jgi:ATP-dependent DNA helicase RecG